jgi:hypothetical protein
LLSFARSSRAGGQTIQKLELERNSPDAVQEFQVEMGHLYHHLNTAWNGREQTDAEFEKCRDEDFARFRKFPLESEIFLD